MAAQQVRDILVRLRNIHEKLALSYSDYEEEAADPRIRAALRCMANHERKIESWLRDHERHTSPFVLESWVQFAPGFSLDRLLREHLAADMTSEDLLDFEMARGQALLGLYRRLADSGSQPRVRDMFESLFHLVESKDLQFNRTLVESVDD